MILPTADRLDLHVDLSNITAPAARFLRLNYSTHIFFVFFDYNVVSRKNLATGDIATFFVFLAN